jgi:hypothetical protein
VGQVSGKEARQIRLIRELNRNLASDVQSRFVEANVIAECAWSAAWQRPMAVVYTQKELRSVPLQEALSLALEIISHTNKHQ